MDRYEVICVIGRGAYGSALLVRRKAERENVRHDAPPGAGAGGTSDWESEDEYGSAPMPHSHAGVRSSSLSDSVSAASSHMTHATSPAPKSRRHSAQKLYVIKQIKLPVHSSRGRTDGGTVPKASTPSSPIVPSAPPAQGPPSSFQPPTHRHSSASATPQTPPSPAPPSASRSSPSSSSSSSLLNEVRILMRVGSSGHPNVCRYRESFISHGEERGGSGGGGNASGQHHQQSRSHSRSRQERSREDNDEDPHGNGGSEARHGSVDSSCQNPSTASKEQSGSSASHRADRSRGHHQRCDVLNIVMDFYSGGDMSRRVKHRYTEMQQMMMVQTNTNMQQCHSGVATFNTAVKEPQPSPSPSSSSAFCSPASTSHSSINPHSVSASAAPTSSSVERILTSSPSSNQPVLRPPLALFPEPLIIDWLVQLLLGLKHIHDRHVLHRDLKTSNIFISREKARPFHPSSDDPTERKTSTIDAPGSIRVVEVLRIGDFGISRLLQPQSHTPTPCHGIDGNHVDGSFAHTRIGTPYSLSPELVEGRPYSHPSDVWALGVVLYEIMTGTKPFQANNLSKLVINIMHGSFAPLPSAYSPRMTALLQAMLNKDPTKRPSVVRLLHLPFLRVRIPHWLSPRRVREEFGSYEHFRFDEADSIPTPVSLHRPSHSHSQSPIQPQPHEHIFSTRTPTPTTAFQHSPHTQERLHFSGAATRSDLNTVNIASPRRRMIHPPPTPSSTTSMSASVSVSVSGDDEVGHIGEASSFCWRIPFHLAIQLGWCHQQARSMFNAPNDAHHHQQGDGGSDGAISVGSAHSHSPRHVSPSPHHPLSLQCEQVRALLEQYLPYTLLKELYQAELTQTQQNAYACATHITSHQTSVPHESHANESTTLTSMRMLTNDQVLLVPLLRQLVHADLILEGVP